MDKKIKVGIVGGSGYTGVELLRILSQHPQVEILTITGRTDAGTPVAEMFPSLRKRVDLTFVKPEDAPLELCDVVFFATPHGVAMSMAKKLTDNGVKLIDLAADFRMQDPEIFKNRYKLEHSEPALLKEAVYGQPETMRAKMKDARILGMAGCYPTSIELGLYPVLQLHKKVGDIVNMSRPIIADAKSGVSGAGKKAAVDLLYAECSDSFKAYAVPGHRHSPEIVQQLELFAGCPVKFLFTPHLVPMIRGIFSTIYVPMTDKGMEENIQGVYEACYAHEPFVDVLPPNSLPQTRNVRGSNYVRMAIYKRDFNILEILVIEDNLVKGAAGQAVQAMNLICGLPETTGLENIPLVP
ncbi:MAG: N-acetyl-gamma-glutamyl-phosphate reductase [Burkholderiales bacterium]|nr:N-acetyl-gamma-glutamyl-phosphate reductase [Burkholderiales bacterium]